MDFKKYSSIENSYRQKYIDKFNEVLPGWQDSVTFNCHEKLDGANIQILFQPNQPRKVGKRTSFLDEGTNFFDIWNTLEKYSQQLEVLQHFSNNNNVTMRVFGELYGPGINGRIDYGKEKKICVFDIYMLGKDYKSNEHGDFLLIESVFDTTELLLSQQEFEALMFNLGLEDLIAPLVGHFDTLKEALSVDVETLQKAGLNGSEGVVVQPFNKVVRMYNGERFIIKKKSKKFEDNQEKTNDQKAPPKEKDIIYNLNKIFRGYITKNRIIDIFAKHGNIQEPKQIGQYLILMLEDAKIDFLKDHDLRMLVPDLDKKREKDLYNVGGIAVNLLKEFM